MKYMIFMGILISALVILSGCNFATANDSDTTDIGAEMWLGEANPNPMPVGGSTAIEYDLKGHRDVQLIIVNVLDQEVRNITASQNGSITWDGTDSHGRLCASGIYYYQLRVGSDTIVSKILLIQ